MRPMRVDDAAAAEHRLAQHGFARRGVADDGEVAEVRRLVGFHKCEVFRMVA